MKFIQRIVLFALLPLAALLFTACSSTRQAMVSPVEYQQSMRGAEEAAAAASDRRQADADRKIVSTVDLSLRVNDTEATLTAINALVDEAGGYVSNTNLYQASQDAEQLEGGLTLRVPSEHLQTTLEKLAALAVKVESQSMNRQDVTDQYVDLHARLRNLEATEQELHTLLTEVRARPDAEATDILTVHQSLTQIRGEIEQVQGQINLLDNTTTLATIHIFLRLDVVALPIVDEGWRPSATLTEALRALTTTLQGIGNLTIWWLAYLMPIVLILAAPVVIAFLLARWFVRQRRLRRGV